MTYSFTFFVFTQISFYQWNISHYPILFYTHQLPEIPYSDITFSTALVTIINILNILLILIILLYVDNTAEFKLHLS